MTSQEERAAKYLSTLHELAKVPLDNAKPIRLYIRSAELVYKQACIYRSEGDLEKAFILYLKYSNLVLRELPKHLEYQANVTSMSILRGNLLVALEVLERSKPILLQKFKEAEAEQARMEQRERELVEARQREEAAKLLAERTLKIQDEARRQRLKEMQKLDMAEAYANKVDLCRSLGNEITTPALIPTPVTSGVVLVNNKPIQPPPPPLVTLLPNPSNYSPLQSSSNGEADSITNLKSFNIPNLNPISPKVQHYLENGLPLRTVMTPKILVDQFLSLAMYNTKKNLETCGVLAGKLSHDVFTISTLIMPKQTSTSDTVTMLNEEEIFTVQDRRELLTLGWIHTHPVQKCFMSSVDLHTHFPYQLLMAEAIAIVVAPTQTPNYGVFRLTDPPGVEIISKCPQRGFHHHQSDRSIYKEISGPEGHLKFSSALPLEVVDLRE